MRRLIRNPPTTLWYDGHTKNTGKQALLIREAVVDKTAFEKCIYSRENTKDREQIAETIMNEMKKVKPLKEVEELYAGTIFNNVGFNDALFLVVK